MDPQEQLDRKSIAKKLPTMKRLLVNVFFLGFILSNSPNQFKRYCAVSLSVLYTFLLGLKDKVLQLDGENPLEAIKWRRRCICVVFAVSLVFEEFTFFEDIDRNSRSLLHVGSRLMVLIPLALHYSLGEFEAVMDSLPGTGKELKGKQNRRVITHIMSFTPICGFFLLTSVGDPWKLAYCGLSYLLASLIAFSSEKVNEWRQESLVLLKMWMRTECSLLISFLALNLVVIYHTQPDVYTRNSLCKFMCGLIVITITAHVVGVELEMGNNFKRKENGSDNGEDTGEPDSKRITNDELEGNLTEIILFLLLCSFGVIVVGLP